MQAALRAVRQWAEGNPSPLRDAFGIAFKDRTSGLTATNRAADHRARMKRVEIGPACPPRALRAEHAAAYLAMSKASFLRLVDEGTMPSGIKVKGMVVWDRHDLDDAFEELKRRSQQAKPLNTMDELLGIKDGEEGN